MKRNIYYKNSKMAFAGALLLLLVTFLGSCVKSRDGRTDFSSLQPVVLIPEGGLTAFSSQALLFPGTDTADTAYFHVNYAATNVAPADETITIGVDTAALRAYNNTNSNQYSLFPDSIYSFTSTQILVKKGNNYSDLVPLILFPDKVDPTKNLMLPISIKTVPSGSTISTNFGTIYYHLIGNPIAGAYTHEWIRYNTPTITGTPAFDQTFDDVFAPLDPTTVSVVSGTGISYFITFTNTGGVLSNFEVTFHADDITANGGGITITGGPTIILADAVAQKYQFNFTYNNAAGAPRNITDKFSK